MSAPAPSTVVVVIGGGLLPVASIDAVGEITTPYVIAADSGADSAVAAGITVDRLVGDMDSIDPATLTATEAAGARVDRHPVDKDLTDFELALEAALGRSPQQIVVVGGDGGRFDHVLGNVTVLAGLAERHPEVAVEAWFGAAHVVVATPRRPVVVRGTAGDLVSMVPLHGPAIGVRSAGLRWELDDETVFTGFSRTMSNELVAAEARIALTGGTLVVIQP